MKRITTETAEQLERQPQALEDSELRFQLAFDEAPIGVALVGPDGRFLRVNGVLCEMVGYSREELTGLTFQAITHPDDLDLDLALMQQLARGDIPRYQLGKRYVRKDGTRVDVLLSRSVVRGPDGAPLYYIAQIEDVTGRKRIEEGLRRSEAQFRGVIEQLPDGAFISVDMRVAYANRALASLLGHADPAALVGTPITQLCHPDDLPRVLERVRVLETGVAVPPRELRIAHRDGSFRAVETTAIRVQFEDRPALISIVRDLAERKLAEREREEAYRRLRVIIDLAPVGIALSSDARHWDTNLRAKQLFGRPIDPSIDASQYAGALLDASEQPLACDELPGARALRGDSIQHMEMRLRQPDGRLLPILVNTAHIPGGETTPPGAVVVFEDISALKDLERLRVEWSALIAHDLRQPLNSIQLCAEIAIQQAAADPALQRRVQQIRSLARRLDRMVQDLVDFTRLEARQLTLQRQSIDLGELVKEATERIALEAPERPIQLQAHDAPVWVDVDPDRIAQVMDNLLTNAIKYGEPGTPIRIDLNLDAGADRASVAVTNHGPGIAPEHMPYLFGRFQRARDAQRRGVKGIGLGLYIARELVEAHQGQIVVESTPGATTTFRFTLALAARADAGPSADPPSR
jgi:PAS domain S-box-containing protein